MRIGDFTEATTYDNTCYMPISIDGATYKTKVSNVAPNVANNLTTTDEGYELDARQGKVLKDAVDDNTDGVTESQGTVSTGIVVDLNPWTLYSSRVSDNSTTLNYPRTAKEVMIHLIGVYDGSTKIFNATFVPGVLTENIYLYLGEEVDNYFLVQIGPETRSVYPITGSLSSASIGTSTTKLTTKVYYR